MVGHKFGELLLLNVQVKTFTLKKNQKKKIKNNFLWVTDKCKCFKSWLILELN